MKPMFLQQLYLIDLSDFDVSVFVSCHYNKNKKNVKKPPAIGKCAVIYLMQHLCLKQFTE